MANRENSNFQFELEEVSNHPTAPAAGNVQIFASGNSFFIQNENNIHQFQTGAGGSVDSVFGRAGNVVSASGDYLTSQITNDSIIVGATLTGVLSTLNTRIDDTGSLLINASGEFLNVLDSGNFIDLQDSGAMQSYILGYVGTTSGHLDEYSLHKSDSGNFLDKVNSGHLVEQIGASSWGEIPSGHLDEYSLHKSDSGNFLDKSDSGLLVDLQDSGAMQSYILGYVGTTSGHIDEYGLHKTDSGNFLDKVDSGNIASATVVKVAQDLAITGVATATFDSIFDSNIYSHYLLHGWMKPTNDNVNWRFRFRETGIDVESSTTHYLGVHFSQISLSIEGGSSKSAAGYFFLDVVGNGLSAGFEQGIHNLSMELRPNSTGEDGRLFAKGTCEWGATTAFYAANFEGSVPSSFANADGIKFDFSAGNIDEGAVTIYGVKK